MIFLVEDDPSLRGSMTEYLRTAGLRVEAFGAAEVALEAARASAPDLVVTDVQLPSMSGLELVAELGKLDPGIVRIVMTAHGSVQTAVAAMRAGAFEFVEKPVDLPRLVRLVERAVQDRRRDRELAWMRETAPDQRLLGDSPAMQEVRRQLEALRAVGTEGPPVLLLGETGVGKGVVAHVLHSLRFKAGAPWIEVNCAALPATLVEAELFGYERSAFTDARQAKPGLFEAASGGTLFLDEVGELPLEAQAKLLKVLESRAVRRLGAVRDRQIDTAIVAASNVELQRAAEDGRFRKDLFHRLAAMSIRVPPLRERAGDVMLLAATFLKEASARYRRTVQRFAPAVAAALEAHPWPGNVRELRFAVERAVLLARADATVLDVMPDLVSSGAPTPADAVATAAKVEVGAGGIVVTLPPAGVSFEALEQAILRAALAASDNNITQAARLLQMSRDTMRYRLRKFGLDTHTG